MYEFLKLAFEQGVFPCVEFTKKDTELDVVSAIPERLEDAVASFIIGDVVGDEIASSHSLPGNHAHVVFDFPANPSREQLGLQADDGSPATAVVEDGMRDELVEPGFVGADEGLARRRFHSTARLSCLEVPLANHSGVDSGYDSGIKVHRPACASPRSIARHGHTGIPPPEEAVPGP